MGIYDGVLRVVTAVADPRSVNWTLAFIRHFFVELTLMLTHVPRMTLGLIPNAVLAFIPQHNANIGWQQSLQVIGKHVAHVAELADALDSGSSE